MTLETTSEKLGTQAPLHRDALCSTNNFQNGVLMKTPLNTLLRPQRVWREIALYETGDKNRWGAAASVPDEAVPLNLFSYVFVFVNLYRSFKPLILNPESQTYRFFFEFAPEDCPSTGFPSVCLFVLLYCGKQKVIIMLFCSLISETHHLAGANGVSKSKTVSKEKLTAWKQKKKKKKKKLYWSKAMGIEQRSKKRKEKQA
jgi:hypothetical protein